MKKKFIALLAVLTMAVLMVACGSNDSKNTSEKKTGSSDKEVVIRVGYFNTAQYQTQLAIAKAKGFFDEEFKGLNVKIEYYGFAGAGPAINEAFLAGELDVAHGIGDQPAISGIANGNGSVIVSRIVKVTRGIGLLIGADSDIKSVKELKGKRVAVGLGRADQKCLDLYLADAGLTENDVQLVNLTSQDEILAAFQKHEIDAATSSGLAYLQDDGVTKVLTTFEEHPNYAYIEFQSEFIKKYPEITERFLSALNKANKWYYENVDEGNKIVADFLGIELEDAIKGNGSSDIGLGIEDEDVKDFEVTYKFLEDNDLLPAEIKDLSTIYDKKYINSVFEADKK